MAREIKENVIAEVSRFENSKGEPTIIRIVSWNDGAPKLEKRSFWINEQGDVRPGKNMGMTAEDFQLLLDKKDEIIAALSGNVNA